MNLKYEKERREIIDIGIKMSDTKLVVGTWGNISRRINENLMAITPSGIDYSILEPKDIPILDLEGNIIDGKTKPSTEHNLHMEVYKCRKDTHAIVHTHSTYCTAFAIARKGIPATVEDLVQIVGGNVRVGEYALPGSVELAKNTIKALEGRNAAILANHGALAVGRNLNEALKIALILEKSAEATVYAKILGKVVELNDEDVKYMRDFYLNSYGQR